jgi:hypothetical protein
VRGGGRSWQQVAALDEIRHAQSPTPQRPRVTAGRQPLRPVNPVISPTAKRSAAPRALLIKGGWCSTAGNRRRLWSR